MIKLYFLLCLIGTLNYSKGQICKVTDGSGSVYEYAPAGSIAWDGGVEGTNGVDYTLQLDTELAKYFTTSGDTLIVKSSVNITRDVGKTISGKLNCFLTSGGAPIDKSIDITVQKININPPVFQGEPYATSLGDGTSVGSQVIVVSATDEEVTKVTYSIIKQTPADVFAITGSSGIITIKNPIQSFVMHNITISATTSGFDNVGGTLIQNTETVVRITITDDDNHAPQFQPTVEVGNILVPPLYTATVVYGETNVNFTSSSIEAKDLDVKLNSAIRYGFVNGDPSTYTEYFQIDQTTGVVSMKKALEVTSGITKFSISVSATEDTGKSSLTYLTIDAVMSVDQHKPMVTVSSSASIGYIQASNANSIAYVTEDEEGNTPFQFTTTDADNNKGTFIYEVTSPYDVTKAGYLIYDPLGTTTTFSDIIEIVAVNIDVDVASPNRRSDPVSITVNSVTTPEPTTMETTQPATTEATTQQVTTPLLTTEQVTTEATTVTTQLSTTEQVTTEATTVTTPVSTTEQVTTEATTVTTPASTTQQVTTQATTVTTPSSTTEQVTTPATTVSTPSLSTTDAVTSAETATTAQVTTQQSTTDSTVVTSTATTPEITTIQTTVVTTQPPDTTQATTVGQSTITNGNTHPSSTAPGSTTGIQSTSPTVVTPTVTPATSAGISTNTVITAPNTTSSQTISIQTSPANPTNNGVNTTAAATNNPHTTVSTSNIPSQPCPVDMTTKGNGVPVGDQVSAVTLYAVAGSLGAALAICLIIIAYLLYKYCREPKDVDDDKSDDGNKPESGNMSSEQIITVTGYSNGAYDKHNESNDGVYTEVNEVEGKENDSGTEINEYDQDRSSPEPEPEEEEEEETSLPEPFVPPEEEDRNSELELPAGGLVAAGIAGAAVAIADEVDDKDVLPLPVNEDDAQDYGKAYVNDDVRHERILKTGSFGSLQLVTIQKYGSERRDKLSVVHKYKLAKISYTEKSSVESRIVLLERICEQEHNNILQYYGKHEDADEIHFAMMYAEKGNLRDHLRSHGHKLSSSQILFLISGAGKGLQYLHSRNIVHCHLQAKCIMLDNQLTPLVTDVENNEIATVKVGDRERWQALEVLNNELSSKSTDIWSFGVLMWEVLSLGAVPYEDLSIATDQIKEYLESGQRLRQPAGCSDAVFKVMEGCWNERSRMRPDVYVLNGSLDEMLTQDHVELISMGVTSNVSPGDVTIDVSTDRLYPNLDQEEDFTAF